VSIRTRGELTWVLQERRWSGAPRLPEDFKRANLTGADLQGAQLSGAQLCGSYLIEAQLSETQLSRTDLSGAQLYKADLTAADLREANLSGARLIKADLREALMSGARLVEADLGEANLVLTGLQGANLTRANMMGARLADADLTGANLTEAGLEYATLVGTVLEHASLSGCTVYSVSAWNLRLDHTVQANLSISPPGEPTITVDNLDMAQFLYLMLHNPKIRDIIDTLTSKVVLILGRFTPERKPVLDAIKEELRGHNYVPVLFDFEGPLSRDFTETVTLLARMARFIIADLTDPASVPAELQAIVPHVKVPVVPLIGGGARPFALFDDLRHDRDWILEIHHYTHLDNLLASLLAIIERAEAKAKELRKRRALSGDHEG
jgi:uncharacterized protein YjbI with pentapeptide repeats